jgi:hypothetical protein
MFSLKNVWQEYEEERTLAMGNKGGRQRYFFVGDSRNFVVYRQTLAVMSILPVETM